MRTTGVSHVFGSSAMDVPFGDSITPSGYEDKTQQKRSEIMCDELTICCKCDSYWPTVECPGPDALCKHPDTSGSIDLVTGEEAMQPCRELNDGHCQYFYANESGGD